VDEHNPNHKGNVAELAIAKEAAELGLSVLMPITEHERYDLALGIGGRLLRVQCKWANRKGDVIAVHLASSRRGPNGYIRKNYSPAEIDAIGVYCGDLDRCFLIPIEDIPDRWAVQLRLAPPRNGQRAAVNFADEYELGAVAQWEERCRGTAEAGGSSPPSSTNRKYSIKSFEEVGAHQFRNHFGHFMERASQGAEVLVRRRGKPYARLCPPELPRRYPVFRSLPAPATDGPSE
jgi:prevent-host-death family protein